MHHAYYFLIIEYSHFSSILYDFCPRVRARGGVRYARNGALRETYNNFLHHTSRLERSTTDASRFTLIQSFIRSIYIALHINLTKFRRQSVLFDVAGGTLADFVTYRSCILSWERRETFS